MATIPRTQIGANSIAHIGEGEGSPNLVTYAATAAETYGKLTFSTAQSSGISLENVARLAGLATPTADAHAANKKYVDDQVSAASAGLDAKDSVLCATTGNITLATPGTIDGVTLVQNARVLVKDQTDASENGIYVAGAGPGFALTRATDMDENDEVAGAYVFIQEGTTMGGQGWVVTAPRDVPTPTIGSDNITWTQFSGATPIADGTVTNAMLQGSIGQDKLAGSIPNAKLANSSVSFGGVSVALGESDATPAFDLQDATNLPTTSLTGTITNAQLAGSIANDKLANSSVSFGGVSLALGASDATPAFDLTDATNYPTSSLTGTITNEQLAGSIGQDKLAGSIPVNKTNLAGGAGLAISGDTIAVDLHATTPCVEIHESKLRLKIKDSAGLEATEQGVGVADNGIANAMLAAGAVTNAKIQAGTVQNDRLQNSSVSFGGVSLALGASDATPAFDLTDATNYPTSSLTGTITNAQLAGSIANDKLVNSAITIAGSATSLGGSIDATTIAAATAPAFANDAISGDKINGGTIGSITISQLAGAMDCANQAMTNVNIDSGNIDNVAITASSLSSTSDARLKDEIKTIEAEEALRVIRESRGVTFRFKKELGGHESAGVVAQEADKVLPRVVSKRACSQFGLKDRHSVDYQAYTGYLLAAQKEMLRRLEEVEGCCRKRKRGRDEEEGAVAKKSR